MNNPDEIAVPEWWRAVRCIAPLVSPNGISPQDEQMIHNTLVQKGFSLEIIDRALAWIDQVAVTGNLADTLSMLLPVNSYNRIDHALEKVFLHPRLRRALSACLRRGFIPQETMERLLESLRHLDTRDWDDAEIERFFHDVLGISNPCRTQGLWGHLTLTELLSDKISERVH